jgi:molecular chaperone DnaK
MIEDAQKYADVDRERKERIEKRTRAEALILQSERQLREVALEMGMQFARYRRQNIDNISRELRQSLKENNDRGIDQAYADLQDALSELNREVRQYYAEDEDENLFGAIRDIFSGDKEREKDFSRDTYRERDSYGRDYRPAPDSRPTRRNRPSYQDNWDDDDEW